MTETVKAKRVTLTMDQKYALMTEVKHEYTNAGENDATFAKSISAKLGFDVAARTVKHYRDGFGVPQIKSAPVSELKARIAELEAKLAALPA